MCVEVENSKNINTTLTSSAFGFSWNERYIDGILKERMNVTKSHVMWAVHSQHPSEKSKILHPMMQAWQNSTHGLSWPTSPPVWFNGIPQQLHYYAQLEPKGPGRKALWRFVMASLFGAYCKHNINVWLWLDLLPCCRYCLCSMALKFGMQRWCRKALNVKWNTFLP